MKPDDKQTERCEACDRACEPGAPQREPWEWLWSEAAQRLLCFCPECSARLPPPSEDNRPMS